MKRTFCALNLALILAIWPCTAQCAVRSWLPPRLWRLGLGRLGWDPQGSIARGMGFFNMGRGMYNLDTAQARAINVNTGMRWNQYAFRSQMAATQRYWRRVQARQFRTNEDLNEIQDRLRNHPETRDITDGDALNILLTTLLNPAIVDRSLQYIKTPVRPQVIQDIPFEVATEGMTVCLDSMTMDGRWPLALSEATFRPERDALRQAITKALKQDEEGILEPETIEGVHKAIDHLRLKFEKLVPQDRPEYIPARNALKAMAGITKMLYSSKIEKILAELEDYQGTTLGDLLGFMQAFNLRFGPANSYRQRLIYLKLYPMLSEQANGSLGALAERAGQDTAVQTLGAVEHPGDKAVASTENLGGKAIEGMKSAATDLFKDMGWEHLSSPSAAQRAQP